MPRSPALARDAAVHRMRRVNRWLIAGTVVAAGLLTDVAAQAFPGRTITRTTGSSATVRARPAIPAETRHTYHHHALKPAARAPQRRVVTPAPAATSAPAPPAPAPAPVVSGGS
jgi:hypothetical protein